MNVIIFKEGNVWSKSRDVDNEERGVKVFDYGEHFVVELYHWNPEKRFHFFSTDAMREVSTVLADVQHIALESQTYQANEVIRASIRWMDTGDWSI